MAACPTNAPAGGSGRPPAGALLGVLLGVAACSVPIFGFDPATAPWDPPPIARAMLLGVAAAAFAWLCRRGPPLTAFDRPSGASAADAGCVVALLFLAGWMRFEDLATIPWGSDWAEGVAAVTTYESWQHVAAAFDSGIVELGWMLPQQSLRFLMANPLAGIRAASAVTGTLGVAALYLFARLWTDRSTALTAAVFLSFDVFHLWSSRTAQPYIYVPTLAVLGWVFLIAGLRRRSRALLAVSGLCAGLMLHTYTLGLLGAASIFGAIGLLWVLDCERVRDQKWGLVALTGTALVASLPMIAFILRQPALYASHPLEISGVVDREPWLGKSLMLFANLGQILAHLFGFMRGQHDTHLMLGVMSALFPLGILAVLCRRGAGAGSLGAIAMGTIALGLCPFMLLRPGYDVLTPRRFMLVLPLVAVAAAIALRTLEQWLGARTGVRIPLAALICAALVLARPELMDRADRRWLLDMQSPNEYLLIQATAARAATAHVMLGEGALRGQIAPVYDVPPDLPFVARAFGANLYLAGDIFPPVAVSKDVTYVIERDWLMQLLTRYFPGGKDEVTIARHQQLSREVFLHTVPAASVRAHQGLAMTPLEPDGAVWEGAVRIPQTAAWELRVEQFGAVSLRIDSDAPATGTGTVSVTGLLHEGWHRVRVTCGGPGRDRPMLRRRFAEVRAGAQPFRADGSRLEDRGWLPSTRATDELAIVPSWDLLRALPEEPEIRAPETRGRARFELRRAAQSGWPRPDRGIMQEVAFSSGVTYALQSGQEPLVALDRDLKRLESWKGLRTAAGEPFRFPATYDPFDWFSMAVLADGRFLLSRTVVPDSPGSSGAAGPSCGVWLFAGDGRLERDLSSTLANPSVKAVAAGRAPDSLFLAQDGNGVVRFDASGRLLADVAGHDPVALAAARNDELLLIDGTRHVVVRLSRDGTVLRRWRFDTGSRAASLAVDARDRVWVLLPSDRRIVVYSMEGELLAPPLDVPVARPWISGYHQVEYQDIAFDDRGRVLLAYRDFDNGVVAFDVIERTESPR